MKWTGEYLVNQITTEIVAIMKVRINNNDTMVV